MFCFIDSVFKHQDIARRTEGRRYSIHVSLEPKRL